MTIAVDWEVKHQIKQTKAKKVFIFQHSIVYEQLKLCAQFSQV